MWGQQLFGAGANTALVLPLVPSGADAGCCSHLSRALEAGQAALAELFLPHSRSPVVPGAATCAGERSPRAMGGHEGRGASPWPTEQGGAPPTAIALSCLAF